MIATVAVNWAAVEPILPELLLITIGVLLIGCDLFLPRQRQLLPWLTVIGCLTALAMILGSRPTVAFGGMFLADGYAMVFKTICLGSVILSVLMSEHFAALSVCAKANTTASCSSPWWVCC
jgi:NADH:ubiquinone oxidoreductase subunit 2 (chain N)